jgi:hypothetical protein
MIDPLDFQITTEDDGTRHAVQGDVALTILPGGETSLFARRAIKKHPSGETENITWLVGELNGVRVYINGSKIVMTTQDLLP